MRGGQLLLARASSVAAGCSASTTPRSAASAPGARGTLERVAPRSGSSCSAAVRPDSSTRAWRRPAGHDVLVLERADEVGGHVRPSRGCPAAAPFAGIGTVAGPAGREQRGGDPHGSTGIAAGGLDELLAAECARPRRRRDRSPVLPRRVSGPDRRAAARPRDRPAASAGTRSRSASEEPAGEVLGDRRSSRRSGAAHGREAGGGGGVRPPAHALADVRHGDDSGGLLHLDPVAPLRSRRGDDDRPFRRADRREPGDAVQRLPAARRSSRSAPTGS